MLSSNVSFGYGFNFFWLRLCAPVISCIIQLTVCYDGLMPYAVGPRMGSHRGWDTNTRPPRGTCHGVNVCVCV